MQIWTPFPLPQPLPTPTTTQSAAAASASTYTHFHLPQRDPFLDLSLLPRAARPFRPPPPTRLLCCVLHAELSQNKECLQPAATRVWAANESSCSTASRRKTPPFALILLGLRGDLRVWQAETGLAAVQSESCYVTWPRPSASQGCLVSSGVRKWLEYLWGKPTL